MARNLGSDQVKAFQHLLDSAIKAKTSLFIYQYSGDFWGTDDETYEGCVAVHPRDTLADAIKRWNDRPIPYIGDEMPKWVVDGIVVKVKMTDITRHHGVRVGGGNVHDSAAWPGEIGIITKNVGNGWWDWRVEFSRGRSTILDREKITDCLLRVPKLPPGFAGTLQGAMLRERQMDEVWYRGRKWARVMTTIHQERINPHDGDDWYYRHTVREDGDYFAALYVREKSGIIVGVTMKFGNTHQTYPSKESTPEVAERMIMRLYRAAESKDLVLALNGEAA